MLPSVPIDKNKIDLVLYSNNIHTIDFELPEDLPKDDVSNKPLQYDEFERFKYIATVSEPFNTPLIGTVIENLFGWGVADYSEPYKITLANRLKGIFE